MPAALRCAAIFAACVLPSARAAAQEFLPPDRGRPPAASAAPAAPAQPDEAAGPAFRVGLFAFTARGGIQVNRGTEGLLAATLDVAQLGAPAVRLRPTFEAGLGRSLHSLSASAEVVYRFQPDPAPAIPYVGLGVGYYHDESSTSRVWPTVVMGFELNLTRRVNWLLEYHALDGLGRSRFLLGLATRGGA